MRCNTEADFWSKVDRSGGPDACWPWTGFRNHTGYGMACCGSRSKRTAQSLALELHCGMRPAGLYALHSCDNPPCCNPAHLRWGTPSENATDRDSRGRFCTLRGNENGSSKLTEAEALAMRWAWGTGMVTKASLGEWFGVSGAQAGNVVERRSWAHV